MFLVIAPSKTQHMEKLDSGETTQPLFLQESAILIQELQRYSVEDLARLMKMSERLAQQTHQRIHAFQLPFTPANASPALFVFQGDVYSRIDTKTYGSKELEYIQHHLCILSGLYGMLRPLDLIQPYRLEMGCELPNSRGRNLYEFWTERLTDAINRKLEKMKTSVLVNLASTEYSRAINKKKLAGSLLQIDFKERQEENYKTVAIHAKRARGMMVDFAVKHKLQTAEGLKNFQQEGYQFRKDLSDVGHYVFTRE